MKKILCLLLCIAAVFAFAACTGEITPDTTKNPAASGLTFNGNDVSGYAVVYPEGNDEAKAAADLLAKLFADCGIELSESSDKLIKVGESTTALSENEYVYEADGANICVNGSGDDSLSAAVLLFVYDMFGYDGYDTEAIVKESKEFTSVKKTYADDINGKFSPIEIYVSTSGDDSASGAKDAPLATVAGAVKLLEGLAGNTLCPVNVKFAEGEYVITETVKITEKSSGRLYSPVEFSAEEGADVTFVGGVKLSASEAKKVTDSAILDKISNDAAKDKIYSIDLSSYFKKIAEVSNQSIDDYYPVQFYVDGKTQTIARYPNVGESIKVEAWASDMEGDGFTFYFLYIPDSVGAHAAKNWDETTYKYMYASGFFSSNDYDEGLKVFEVAKEASEARKQYEGKAYFHTYTQIYSTITPGQTFYFYNMLEEIDTAGEYYIDVDSKTLYFYSDGSISDDMYVSSLGENMFNVANGSSDVTFKNINIAYTRAKAINIQGSTRVSIEDCSFSCISSNAISFTSTTNSSVKNASISECGRGGIVLTRCGSVANSTDANITISGCDIKTANLVKYTGSACVSISNSCGVTLKDNTVDGNGIDAIIESNTKNITK